MKIVKVTGLAFAVALAGCSSGFEQAKQEAIDSCISSASGRLTDGECTCMIDKAFDSLDAEEKELLGKIAQTEKGIDDEELAERIGVDRSEMQSTMRSAMGKIRDTQIASARQCMGQ
ncbi:hypothetical protein [Pseudoblastomonas halimionae]|uniref:Lipoprotein n=1 Tax=Alteriqipengyuania halimionae TaxID=1926630 RepID=A0A6I4U3F1_9SPHN|nr:hypothetical protein [Alteriqipengyuania halimionae]MXP10609.1 hypothetical protein [Alteriqipengyuania halimionae]